jgi:hypothetical protein
MCVTQTHFRGANHGLQGLSVGLNAFARAARESSSNHAAVSHFRSLADITVYMSVCINAQISTMHKKVLILRGRAENSTVGAVAGISCRFFNELAARKSIILVLRKSGRSGCEMFHSKAFVAWAQVIRKNQQTQAKLC